MRTLPDSMLSRAGALTTLAVVAVVSTVAPDVARADPPPLLSARLTDAAPYATTPSGAPDVIVQMPPELDRTAALRLVVFLHGHVSCVARYLASEPTPCLPGAAPLSGLGVAAAHAQSHDGSILIAPQLAWIARSSDPGRFRERGFFARFLREVLTRVVAPSLGRSVTLEDVGSITIVAHSGGYLTALRLLENGDLADRVESVVLLDALYAGVSGFAGWAAHGRHRIVSLYTAQPTTSAHSTDLARRLTPVLGAGEIAIDPAVGVGHAIAGHRVVVARARVAHNDLPSRYLAEILAALASPPAVSAGRLPR